MMSDRKKVLFMTYKNSNIKSTERQLMEAVVALGPNFDIKIVSSETQELEIKLAKAIRYLKLFEDEGFKCVKRWLKELE